MTLKKIAGALGLLAAAYAAPLAADDAARAVFSMICIREAQSLGHKDDALRKYVSDCVAAKIDAYGCFGVLYSASFCATVSRWFRSQQTPFRLAPSGALSQNAIGRQEPWWSVFARS